jgi:hypothetical protein
MPSIADAKWENRPCVALRGMDPTILRLGRLTALLGPHIGQQWHCWGGFSHG